MLGCRQSTVQNSSEIANLLLFSGIFGLPSNSGMFGFLEYSSNVGQPDPHSSIWTSRYFHIMSHTARLSGVFVCAPIVCDIRRLRPLASATAVHPYSLHLGIVSLQIYWNPRLQRPPGNVVTHAEVRPRRELHGGRLPQRGRPQGQGGRMRRRMQVKCCAQFGSVYRRKYCSESEQRPYFTHD